MVLVCAALVKELNLNDNKIGDIGAEKLAGALPNLKNLTETWFDLVPLAMEFSCAAMFRAHIVFKIAV